MKQEEIKTSVESDNKKGKSAVVKNILSVVFVIFVLVSAYFMFKLGYGQDIESEKGIRLRYYILPFNLVVSVGFIILGVVQLTQMFNRGDEKLSFHILMMICAVLFFLLGVGMLIYYVIFPLEAIPYLHDPVEVKLVEGINFKEEVGEYATSYILTGVGDDAKNYSFNLNRKHFRELLNLPSPYTQDYIVQYIPYIEVVLDVRVVN